MSEEHTTTIEPTQSVSQPVSEAPAWSGDLTALEKEQWYAGLDEPTRNALRSGVETRFKNYEKGITQKVQSFAQEKKDLEARIAKSERAMKLYEQLAQGEEDPRVAEADAKLAELQAQLEALTGERDQYRTKYEEREHAENHAAAQKLAETYADIMANDAAAERFLKLMRAEIEPDEAARMVHALHPDLSDSPEKLPNDIALMSRGDGSSGKTQIPSSAYSLREQISLAVAKAARLHGME